MAINSMTGFGKGKITTDAFELTVEMKSVNNRFKDIRFKMGQIFFDLEIELKKKIEEKFVRGSFDIFINYKKNQQANGGFELDPKKIKSYLDEIKAIANSSGISLSIKPTEFLRNDFVLEDSNKEDALKDMLREAFSVAISNLYDSRVEEGIKLIKKLKEYAESYKSHYLAIIPLKNDYQNQVREKLLKKFESENMKNQIDDSRFNQEVIYYLEKLDIDEEITRIDGHLNKLNKILNSNGEVGRQLDFMLQELGRETNTIGSKANNIEISSHVVEMKVYLEKIREQALNLE